MSAAEAAPSFVLDASALLAWLQNEDGASEVVSAFGAGTAVSVVNWAEALSKIADAGREPTTLVAELSEIGVDERMLAIEPLTEADCIAVARLRPITRALGLSLADRACLVLAERLGVPALTADHGWEQADLSVDVKLIR